MTTLLIVDDEPRQVKALAAIIGRQRPQYRILEATDAESAWENLEREAVDAVLTDIRMPDVDGLTLIERIARHKPYVKTVLISGYGQFDYAKKAIEFRVVEYLVKPIGLPDIERVIGKLEDLFARESALHQSVTVYQEHLWNGLIAGSLNERQRLELERQIPATGTGFAMAMDNGPQRASGSEPCEPYSADEAKERWAKLLSSIGRTVTFGDTATGRIVSFVWLERPLAAKPSDTVSKVVRLFERFRADVTEGAVLGVSTIRLLEPQRLKDAYDEALLALRHRFYSHDESILWGSDVRAFTERVTPGSKELAEPLTLAVKAGDRTKAMELFHAFFRPRETPPYPEPDRIKEELNLILWQMTEGLQGMLPADAQELNYYDQKKRLGDCIQYRELKFRFKKLLEGWLEQAGQVRLDKNGLIVLRCQAYLQQHYMEDLSLESVASLFHFNPSYFSNLFKSKTGLNFSEYLLEVRIRQAKAMLENGQEKIADISEKVGFRNAAYFNKMFKRETGLSPNVFRQMKGKGAGA
ncbi:response regulator [Cohnella sp. CFH 77786]|uniref:response regulator n=1 Tax=Cohnella sp. CFH 77786 TaxID=2662265 RepID=UPI001C60D95D|nr:response regulator [Cohnella sp. CFH 77786]